MAHPLMHENIWFDKWRYDDAEVAYQMGRAAGKSSESSIASEIARAREQIHKSLQMDSVKVSDGSDSSGKLASLIKENSALKKATDDLWTYVKKLEARIESLEKKSGSTIATTSTVPASPAASKELAQPKKETAPEKDDDFDLFGDEEEEEDSEEKKRQTEERLKLYEAKKAGKTALIAKSCVILDVKPWDDETDMKAMETNVRTIEMDGLVWGAAKLIPLAYGIHKLQISCVVEDEKVSVDELQEKIESFEDYVQSVDIAAFNKL